MRRAETASLSGGRRHPISSIVTDRLPDEHLTRRVAAGDHSAFDALYRRYARRLAAYGARLLGDSAKGEDVAQTALMNAYQALLRGSRPRHVKAWLYRIAQNSALEILARQKETAAEVEVEIEGEDALEAHAVRGQLVAALRGLPDRQRRTYLLREMHGLQIKEIEERLGLTAQQVEQALFAARNRLAEELVFGERLTCDTVQALDGAALVYNERRALRGHLRACPSCRASVRVSGGLAGLSPVAILGWLRDGLSGLLAGGGVPLAAKATVAVATVALASSVPVPANTFLGQDRTARTSDAPARARSPVADPNANLAARHLEPVLVHATGSAPHPAAPGKDTAPPSQTETEPDPGSTDSTATDSPEGDPAAATEEPASDVPADPPPDASEPPPDPPPDEPAAPDPPPDPPPSEPPPEAPPAEPAP